MRHLNKLATAFCAAALGLLTLTSCEGGDLYSIDSPDWLSSRADSIAAEKANNQNGEEEIEGLQEDVYTVGATDYSTGWWAVFSKYYQIPEGQKWVAQFNLSINPAATNTYKNFAMIICNDEDRGAANYKEYGAIRYDYQPSGNSEWGDYIDRSLATSTLEFATDTDTGVDKLGGKVTLTVDRTNGGLEVTMTNGTVTKTYKQTSPLTNLNADESNGTIRCFLVPEGSCINFLGSTIEPIGGFTSKEDKLPLSMTLNGVPKKVLQGVPMEEAFANVTATVEFEQAVSKVVPYADLTFQVIPDLNNLGTVHSDKIKVNPGETFISTFTNYTSGEANWNNFVVCLTNGDGSTEYGILRADNWGWGTGWAGEELASRCTPSGGQADWATWLAAMDGAKVTVYVTNNGDGTCDVRSTMIGNDGNIYHQDYIGLNTVTDPNDFYFHYTVDKCHLEFSEVLGNEDNSTGWWVAHSTDIVVPEGKTYSTRFKNYTNGATNWNNFLVVLTREDNSEYTVLRADNYGWGDSYASCTPVMEDGRDWDAWLSAMDGATVTVSVTNNGNSADVKCVVLGNDGITYKQDYLGISPIEANNFRFRFTVEGGHLVFE